LTTGLVSSTGNITSAGNIIVGGSNTAPAGFTTTRANVAVTTTATVLDQFSPSTFRAAKYVVIATGANGYQATEVLLLQDGTNAYITVFADLVSNATPGADVIDISANINGGTSNVTLYAAANATFGATANVKVVPIYLTPN
jgi:hypothetical protein